MHGVTNVKKLHMQDTEFRGHVTNHMFAGNPSFVSICAREPVPLTISVLRRVKIPAGSHARMGDARKNARMLVFLVRSLVHGERSEVLFTASY